MKWKNEKQKMKNKKKWKMKNKKWKTKNEKQKMKNEKREKENEKRKMKNEKEIWVDTPPTPLGTLEVVSVSESVRSKFHSRNDGIKKVI